MEDFTETMKELNDDVDAKKKDAGKVEEGRK